jgi:putative ABC transport system permease protein
VLLSVVIVFGVVYNSMRIQLSERARELASLRVLGFTKAEVSVILLSELILLTLIAIPVGWLLGYGMAAAVSEGLTSELFRIPLYVSTATYAEAAIVVLLATAVSAFVVQRRVAGLDMIAVLKTRE